MKVRCPKCTNPQAARGAAALNRKDSFSGEMGTAGDWSSPVVLLAW